MTHNRWVLYKNANLGRTSLAEALSFLSLLSRLLQVNLSPTGEESFAHVIPHLTVEEPHSLFPSQPVWSWSDLPGGWMSIIASMTESKGGKLEESGGEPE